MDREEFSRRVNGMMDRLYRISYSQLREPQDRMDAVQDALLKAWSNRHRLKNPEYFETWLIRILLNSCHDQQRRSKRVAPLEEMPEVAEASFDGNPEVRDAILRLNEKQRTTIVLFYMEDYSVDEIARILKIPRETVRTRLRRGRDALRALLEPEGKEG